jgi:hypothetical protein
MVEGVYPTITEVSPPALPIYQEYIGDKIGSGGLTIRKVLIRKLILRTDAKQL